MFNLDASGHVPRNVADLDLNAFDLIVSLDPEVSKVLKQRKPEGLIKSHVDDPWGDPEKYATCAVRILRQLGSIEAIIRQRERPGT